MAMRAEVVMTTMYRQILKMRKDKHLHRLAITHQIAKELQIYQLQSMSKTMEPQKHQGRISVLGRYPLLAHQKRSNVLQKRQQLKQIMLGEPRILVISSILASF
jgi:hypothetical protein